MIKDMSQKRDNNQTALAGEFAVLSQLALHRCDASMTLGNTKNIDILIYNPETKKYAGMEVKTSTQKKPINSIDFGKIYDWPMNEKHEDIKDKDLFYCFVLIQESENKSEIKFRFFIVPSDKVATYVKAQHQHWKDGNPRRGKTRNKQTKMRMFRLGLKGEKYTNVDTPLLEDYENKWDLLK